MPSRSGRRRSPGRASPRCWWPCVRSPVTFQMIARAIRPPSRGNAGIRLKTSSTMLMLSRKASIATRPPAVPSASNADGVPEVVGAAGDQHAEAGAEDRDHERHQRARRPRPGTRRPGDCGVPRHLRDAAEQPQVDARDRDAVADRHHRVAQLVQQDRQEEQQRADRREHEGAAVVAAWQRRLVVVGQPPDEQEQREEPARIHADADAEDPHERDRSAAQHALDGRALRELGGDAAGGARRSRA